jgi:citrate lyase subunit beta/citryl-CoA lyase
MMGDDLAGVRSLLFAPGSDERKLARALAGTADAVIADLEDAVAPEEKPRAREVVARAMRSAPAGPLRLVRVNAPDSAFGRDDLAALRDLPLDGIVVPKATPQRVAALGPGGPRLIALVETAAGLRTAYETARLPRVAALMLGGADLAAELALGALPDGEELLHARSSLVVDSAAAGVRAPFDVVHLDLDDLAGLERQARLARALGFGGKACIHPRQVDAVHRAFTPSAAEVEHAREVVAAFDAAAGRGAIAVRGRMVDLPVAAAARAMLARAARPRRPDATKDDQRRPNAV